MTPTLSVLAYLLVIAACVAGFIYLYRRGRLVELLRERARREYVQRERERFQVRPRVGDLAGYAVSKYALTDAERATSKWRVGRVVVVDALNPRQVTVLVPRGDGPSVRWTCNVDELTWFPPDTALGQHDWRPE